MKKREKKSAETSSERPLYRFEGYCYRPEVHEDVKRDTYSVVHRVEKPTGEVVIADFTPHLTMTRVDFETYVRLECPGRQVAYRPLSPHDLRRWRGALKAT